MVSTSNKNLKFYFFLFSTLFLTLSCNNKPKKFTNSLGTEFVLIPSGYFLMGESNKMPSQMIEDYKYLKEGDFDEHPVHEVEISKSFYISTKEITIEEFKKFRENYVGAEEFAPFASGISWYEAVEFCNWLSEKEGKTYRLPTEAEWEYACRAGTKSLFWSGESLPDSNSANPWGLINVHSQVAEWCYDWYGEYPNEEVVDPIGVESSFTKVVRGGGLDKQTPYFARSANRASIAPNFPPRPLVEMKKLVAETQEKNTAEKKKQNNPAGFKSRMAYKSFTREVLDNQGNHNIGFRIVQAPMPDSKPLKEDKPFVQQGVKQTTIQIAKNGPNPNKPYFRKRYLLPTPPENMVPPFESEGNTRALDAIEAVGFDPGILSHHHSPALEVMPNGDILAIFYTSVSELTPDVAMIAARLRFGQDQWDFPNMFIDFADVDDHAPMLWSENDTIRFFWGANKLDSGFPFQWINSTDNGATWSKVHFPVFETQVGGHSAQPINSAFRDLEGTIYVASDAIGPESVLWKSFNNGKTWIDNGGRSGGRHTSFVLLKNGDILGMGGKSSELDGYMPKSISSDNGKTWEVKKTPFTPLGSNQRPTVIRLLSGKLFFAGDYQRKDGYQPPTVKKRGAYAALSDDEGETWHIKQLPGAQEHELEERRKSLNGETIGYSVARQAQNGIIHLISTMNDPCLHFEFNEEWILSEVDYTMKSDAELMKAQYEYIEERSDYSETYSDGSLKMKWQGGYGEDGQFLFDGKETWYYKNGEIKYEAEYITGKKINSEIYWFPTGNKKWETKYIDDGSSIWTTYWEDGSKKTESTWKNKHAEGMATKWDKDGNILYQIQLEKGKPKNEL